jgi:hypothetical protein
MELPILTQLISKAYQSGYRSTILRPIYGLSALTISAIAIFAKVNVATWIINGLAIVLFVIIGVAVFSYLYCLVKDRSALRTESYSLSKLAIERGIYGDDKVGIIKDDITSITPTERLIDNTGKLGGKDA